MLLMGLDIDAALEQRRITTDEVVDHLVANYYSGLRRLVQSILRDSDAADDIVQETLIIAANKIDQYKPHTNLKAWVFKIGVNQARMALRKNKSKRRILGLLQGQWRPNNAAPSSEAALLETERHEQLWTAVQKLKEKHRIPILLRYSQDMKPGEIAEVLDVPVGTIHSRLHHAHKQLRGLLVSEEVAA